MKKTILFCFLFFMVSLLAADHAGHRIMDYSSIKCDSGGPVSPIDLFPVHVFRFFNNFSGGHFYTSSRTERDYMMGLPEWDYEGPSFMVFNNFAPKTTPVYRFFNTETGFHLYTICVHERDTVLQIPEWDYEGIKFYVYAGMEKNSKAVYRFFNHIRGSYFYTISEHERDTVMQMPDWTFEGVPFYALPLIEGNNKIFGKWHGTAQVREQTFLQEGNFPVTLAIAQSGNRIRGIIDIEQNVDILAEAFCYLFDGHISGNSIYMELTDRMCGQGYPEHLCYPANTVQKVFYALGNIEGSNIILHSVSILPGITYPEGVDIEIPFEYLNFEYDNSDYDEADHDIAGEWHGTCYIPMSVIYLMPLPLFGQNEMTIGYLNWDITLLEFINEGINIVPDFNDIILSDTFKYNSETGRFWFVQLGTTSYRWLWAGVIDGNKLSGIVAFDYYNYPVYDSSIEPVDFFEIDFINTAAVFEFCLE